MYCRKCLYFLNIKYNFSLQDNNETSPCQEHPSLSLEHFCCEPSCRLSICKLCKVLFHRDHFVMTLDDKIRQTRNRLELALGRIKADSKSINERQSDVTKSLQDCDSAAELAQKQMRQQYHNITVALAKRYCDQVILLSKTKEDQIVQFSEELTMLQNFSDEKNILLKTVQALLDQPFTDEVLVKAENILSQNHEDILFSEKDKWWNGNLYKPPDLQPEDFGCSLLGQFDVNHDLETKAEVRKGQKNKKSKTNVSLGTEENIPQKTETAQSTFLKDQEKEKDEMLSKSLSWNEKSTQENYEQFRNKKAEKGSEKYVVAMPGVSGSKSQSRVQSFDFKNERTPLTGPKSLLLTAKSKYHNNCL